MYILIIDGKIREFDGADFVPLILHGTPQPDFKTFGLNADFKLEKVSKYDRNKHDINANYKIICHELFSKCLKDTYIKLNWCSKFRIDYAKKEDVLHKMNFNQKLVSFIVFTTLPFLIGFSWKYLFTNTDEKGVDSVAPLIDKDFYNIHDSTSQNDTIVLPQSTIDTDTLQ